MHFKTCRHVNSIIASLYSESFKKHCGTIQLLIRRYRMIYVDLYTHTATIHWFCQAGCLFNISMAILLASSPSRP